MTSSSFLPDDYLDQKAERRTNLISLVLFALVMSGVFLAFLFTNQRWSGVKRDQETIDVRYENAAGQIKELLELEEQKREMLQKANLAAALVERVPRSVLLAELINRMPDKLSLLEFRLKSDKIKVKKPAAPKKDRKSKRLKPEKAKSRKEAKKAQAKIHAPKYSVSIALIGVAPTGKEVSRYLAELNAYDLLREVRLEYTERKEIEGQTMQQFKIKMKLTKSADVRNIDPRILPREDDAPGFRVDISPAPMEGDADPKAGGTGTPETGQVRNTNETVGLETVIEGLRDDLAGGTNTDDDVTEDAIAEAKDDRNGE